LRVRMAQREKKKTQRLGETYRARKGRKPRKRGETGESEVKRRAIKFLSTLAQKEVTGVCDSRKGLIQGGPYRAPFP